MDLELQPICTEVFRNVYTNMQDGALLDMDMYGFWGGQSERAFVYVNLFNPYAASNSTSPSHLVMKSMSMNKDYGIWNMSLHTTLFSQPLVAWLQKLPFFTKDLPLN